MRLVRASSRVSTPVSKPVHVAARPQEHHDLLQRAVARPLADAVHGALHLAGAGEDAGVRVRDRETQVVVAVDRDPHLPETRNQVVQALEVALVLGGRRVADGVGDVHHRRALLHGDRADLGRELDVGPRRVHRRELDVLAVGARQGHGRARLALHVVARRLELVLDVDVRGRDERVDPRARRVLDRAPRGVDVGLVSAGETADHGALHASRDRLDGLEVAGRGDREARLDHVDAQSCELLGDLDLLLGVQRDARGLLAVPQRRVKDVDALVVRYRAGRSLAFPPSPENFDDLVVAAIAPPSANPPAGGGEGEARGWTAGESSGRDFSARAEPPIERSSTRWTPPGSRPEP